MATYTTYRRGSKDTDTDKGISKLQQALVDKDYDIGESGVDGNYGPATEKAIRAYQQDNNLQVDGIAGPKTLGALYGGQSGADTGNSDSTGTQPQQQVQPVQNTGVGLYDPQTDSAYLDAMAALDQANSEKPVLKDSFGAELDALYDQIVNREDFSYDMNGDPTYRQYKDSYIRQGHMAMMDTMGQAAAMTGGYGSSYGQTAGQQAYQAYLQQLGDIVPELEQNAYARYLQEGQDLLDQYALLEGRAADEYSKSQDQLDEWWRNVGYLQDKADTAYNRGMAENETAYNREQDDKKWDLTLDEIAYEREQDALDRKDQKESLAYERQQDAYSKLATLISSSGYIPSDAELTAAGMTKKEAEALKNAYTNGLVPEPAVVDSEILEALDDLRGDDTAVWQYLESRVAGGQLSEDQMYSLWDAYLTQQEDPTTYEDVLAEVEKMANGNCWFSEIDKYLEEAYNSGYISKTQKENLSNRAYHIRLENGPK